MGKNELRESKNSYNGYINRLLEGLLNERNWNT